MTLSAYYLHFLLSLICTDFILTSTFIAASEEVLNAFKILCNAAFCSFCKKFW